VQAYEVVLHERAWEALAALGVAERRRVLGVLDRLKIDPFRVGDFRERDQTGRLNEVWLVEEWLVTFWADHLGREIRVINLERVED
jgi:hypothetical protein